MEALTPLQSGISEVTSDLGLTLKPKQEICLQKFASGRDVFVSYPLVMENPCVIFYCQGYLMLLEVFLDSQLF